MMSAAAAEWRATQPDDLGELLRARISRIPHGGMERDGSVVFDAGAGGAWTVHVRGGRATVAEGSTRRATATLTASAATLAEVVTGETPGVAAFLEGRLAVRGSIAYPIELEAHFRSASRDVRAPRCRRVSVDGVASFLLEAGPADGVPIVLLHGLGATSSSFLPTQWDLARDYHVYAADLPGFGESGKPLTRMRPEFFARWGVALLDALGIERAHLVGNSMGGRVALEMALHAPHRVDRVALLAPSMAWRRYRQATRLVRILRPELGALPIPVLRELVLGVLRAMFSRPERVSRSAMNAASDEFLRIFATPRGRIAFFSAAREIYLEEAHGDDGFWDRLPALSRPSLFIFGARDRLVPHGFARYVREAVSSATVEIFDDCGHVPQFELPERTNAHLRAFFAG